MKISAQQYAKSLYDSVIDKNEKEVKAVLKNFVALLGRNRELNRADEIMAIFVESWNKAHGELSAELISARELGKVTRDMVVSYLQEKTGAKTVTLDETVDQKLIGGFVLKYDSKILDASLKTSLDELKNKISN
jgi:F-type H+-transporting ATPase subunit delta